MDSIAVYDVKPSQQSAPPNGPADGDDSIIDLSFNLELEHRVWLAKYKVDRRDRARTDPARLDWDSYQPDLCLPDVWQPSWLATTGMGGTWQPGQLGDRQGDGPLPGDRVVVYRTAPQADIVGVWLVTGCRWGSGGEVRLGHRPLVSCIEPVELRSEMKVDADLGQCWEHSFGRRSRSKGLFFQLDGAGLSAIMRTVGIDPQLLCGPASLLPDCSMSNVRPGGAYRPATYLHTVLSAEGRAESKGVAEAADWYVRMGFDEVETVASHGSSVCLVARRGDDLAELVAAGVIGASVDDIELCPTVVLEATVAAATGRVWSLVVTLDALGLGRTIRFNAQAVTACFDPVSGRVSAS